MELQRDLVGLDTIVHPDRVSVHSFILCHETGLIFIVKLYGLSTLPNLIIQNLVLCLSYMAGSYFQQTHDLGLGGVCRYFLKIDVSV